MTPKDLLEQLREYLTDCGYEIYNDYKSCMPSTLKRFDDVRSVKHNAVYI